MTNQQTKVFVIGLPRTGTTSMSIALLALGYKVAHQGFTQQTFALADAVTDAPCFSDYPYLHQLYPNAKFIYLNRNIDAWVASMQMLLSKMLPHLHPQSGRFHPVMKRSFEACFGVSTCRDPLDEHHLRRCFAYHQQQVYEYFNIKNNELENHQFLEIDVSTPKDMSRLQQFLMANIANNIPNFPHSNQGSDVAGWDEFRHPNKVVSNASGQLRRKYFDYKPMVKPLPWVNTEVNQI
ncbi:sulfotransferase family protein [Shewanella waksmanii]|uniref:sulfotransferase family protein n=1 Tax=Shewanella waksmanii TaxID=213783 RepID=UPI00373562AC